jgi:hypothetical protein
MTRMRAKQEAVGSSSIPVLVCWVFSTLLSVFLMASYTTYFKQVSSTTHISSIDDLIDSPLGVLHESGARRLLYTLVPGSRVQSFATLQDMLAALRNGQVQAIVDYEWNIRFGIGSKEDNLLQDHGFILMNYAFRQRYMGYRVSPVWCNRSHFNRALSLVIDGTGQYGDFPSSFGLFQGNWSAQLREDYRLDQVATSDLVQDYNHWSCSLSAWLFVPPCQHPCLHT